MMEHLGLWFGLLGGLVTAAQVAASVSQRIRRVRRLHLVRRRKLQQAVVQMREKAKGSLDLRREVRGMERELARLTGGIDQGEASVERARAGSESQLYVVDERRQEGDGCFVLTVRHPQFGSLSRNAPTDLAESWRQGRRYVVWAAAAKLAEAKTSARFPADRGYVVGTPEPLQGTGDSL